jgi:hypothetical protein
VLKRRHVDIAAELRTVGGQVLAHEERLLSHILMVPIDKRIMRMERKLKGEREGKKGKRSCHIFIGLLACLQWMHREGTQ